MKKAKFKGKLELHKETLAQLNQQELDQVNGGFIRPFPTYFCSYHYCTLTTPWTCPTVGPACY